MKGPWFQIAMLFFGSSIGSGVTVYYQHNKLHDQTARLEHRDLWCHQVQFQAADARTNLRSADPARRDWGLGQYKVLDLGAWQMANMCADPGISIGASCDDDDLACQLHALDWALINIR